MASSSRQLLISRSSLKSDALKGEVALVTGAGRGIGYEASRALLWLGARVIVAEIDDANCMKAVAEFQREFGNERAIGIRADVGSEEDVSNVVKTAVEKFSRVDIVLNNATAINVGAVKEVGIKAWDEGYRVNLRGPVLLAKALLPGMVARKHGVFVCVSSSGAAPYMGPYEVFKTAQVELANTIAAELGGVSVYAYAIGPGVVRTPGFLQGGSKVAAMMGITVDDLVEMNKSALLTVEEAGAGFAASVALAEKYNGTETSSIQVLREVGIISTGGERENRPAVSAKSSDLLKSVIKTYVEQSKGWKDRNIFQRQWVFRDFKKQTGMSVDEMRAELTSLGESLKGTPQSAGTLEVLATLNSYYKHQQDLLRGFEKDPKKLEENMKAIQSWMDEIQLLLETVK